MRKKVIARIKGGLGNQLFCYAAARRLALANEAELVIDDVTGFVRDRLYQRQYALDPFSIPTRKATPLERLEPFERLRRGTLKFFSRRKPFHERTYVEQEGLDFDERLLSFKVKNNVYIDGLWQSEGYFKDVEDTIRNDLRITLPIDHLNVRMAEEVLSCNSVALHVRWFDQPDSKSTHNTSLAYYQKAIGLMIKKLNNPRFFLFSDDPGAAQKKLQVQGTDITPLCHNTSEGSAYKDLWLMTQCKHFITANSTFSWWGAWLAGNPEKFIVTPDLVINGKTAWGFRGLIPKEWVRL